MPCIHITPNNHQMRSRDYSQSHLLLGACSHLPDGYYTPLNSVDIGETHNVPTNYDATCNIRMMTPRDYCGVREARQGALSLRSLDYCQSSDRNVEETSAVNSRCCTEPIPQPQQLTHWLAASERTSLHREHKAFGPSECILYLCVFQRMWRALCDSLVHSHRGARACP